MNQLVLTNILVKEFTRIWERCCAETADTLGTVAANSVGSDASSDSFGSSLSVSSTGTASFINLAGVVISIVSAGSFGCQVLLFLQVQLGLFVLLVLFYFYLSLPFFNYS